MSVPEPLVAGTLDAELEARTGARAELLGPASDGRGLVLLHHGDADSDPGLLVQDLTDAGAAVLRLRVEATAADRDVCALVERALAHLAGLPGVEADRLGLLGRGVAGVQAYLAACTGRRVSALVLVDTDLVRESLDEAHPFVPLEMALNLDAPLLAVYGGASPTVPPASQALLRERLAAFARPLDEHHAPGDVLADGAARAALLSFLDAVLV